jgi:hypothetical protein
LLFAFFLLPLAHAADFYVTTDGSDSNPGTIGQPFGTLNGARTAIRALSHPLSSGVTVWIRDGRYFLQTPFALSGSQDSGTPGAAITYRSYLNETPYLIGGTNVGGFVAVTNAAVLARLTDSAKTNVLVANLGSQGITNLGVIVPHGYNHSGVNPYDDPTPWQAELLFQDKAMQLARYPNNSNWLNIAASPAPSGTTSFGYTGNEPSNWVAMADILIQGFWNSDFAESTEVVSSINTGTKAINIIQPGPAYNLAVGQRFCFLNVLEELDIPGEYYVDRTNGLLYFWPPSAITNGSCILSTVTNLVTLTAVSNVAFSGLTFEGARQKMIVITAGKSNLVTQCTLRGSSGSALQILSSPQTGVSGCAITDTGERGVFIYQSGSRSNLVSGSNFITFNTISNVSRLSIILRPPIQISATWYLTNQDVCGVYVAHNLIHHAPHMAILYYGNNHVIEYNEFHHVITQAADAGVIYAGGDWSFHGNIIRYNYFHDVNVNPGSANWDGVKGVYLDDGTSGTTVYGNVFCNVDHGVFVNGGHNNVVMNNIFVDCTNYNIGSMAAFGLQVNQWITQRSDLTNQLTTRLQAMPYQTPPWSTQYPDLVTMLTDHPYLAISNVIATNIFYHNLSDVTWAWGAQTNTAVLNNLTNTDPLFVNYSQRNFALLTNSPAWALGFQAIPTSGFGPGLLPASGLQKIWPR